MYSNILNAIFGKYWYASEEYMQAIVQIADNIFSSREFFESVRLEQQKMENDMVMQEEGVDEPVFLGRTGTYSTRIQLLDNGTAVVPITGVIAPKLSAVGMCMAGTSMDMLSARARELAQNEDVTRVVLHVNSGGGSVLGVPEATRALRELAKVKPMTAYYDHIGASAAFFLSSVAPKRVVTDSSIVGSVGVYTVVATQAERLKKAGIEARIIRAGKFKAMPNSIEPFKAQQAGLNRVMKDVQAHYDTFVQAIQQNLNITMSEATKLADGTVETGSNAIKRGFATESGPLGNVLSGDIQSDLLEEDRILISTSTPVPADEPQDSPKASVIVEEVEEPETTEVEASKATDSAKEIAALKVKVLLLEGQVEASTKIAEETKAKSEKEKILGLIETGLEDGRIAAMKADTITELAFEMGFEKFETLLDSIPKAAVMEDLSKPLASEEADDEFASDPYAPTTASEKALFASIPELKKRYKL